MQTETKSKVREFINPEKLLSAIPVEPGMVVADFGAGNGHFAVAAARLAGRKGQVRAYDIMEEALSQTATLARMSGVPNVSTHQCNLEKVGACDLEETSADLVIMSSILHQVAGKDNLIREAYRVLKTGGRILVVEWKKESPLGPAVSERLDMAAARQLLEARGLHPASPAGGPPGELPAGAFHYALMYSK